MNSCSTLLVTFEILRRVTKIVVMKYIRFFIFMLAIGLASAQQIAAKAEDSARQKDGAAIVYAEGGGFMMSGPRGWIADRAVGERLGTCCVYYPEGSTWDNAETVMYPNIATKREGQKTLKEFMANDLAGFQKDNPEMTFTDGEPISLKDKRSALVRYFYGVNQKSFEAVAYIDQENVIALIVVSPKTQKGLSNAMPLLREVLQNYAYMNVHIVKSEESIPKPAAQAPKN